MGALRERAVDVSLALAACVCGGLLVAMIGQILFYIACGLFFMGVAAYTLVQGQMAESRRIKLAWFMCTGITFFLFSYWAFQVVFRPPQVKTSIGCGGVKFVTTDGNGNTVVEHSPWTDTGPRTEL